MNPHDRLWARVQAQEWSWQRAAWAFLRFWLYVFLLGVAARVAWEVASLGWRLAWVS